MKILVINGPNINMLGIREKHIYGTQNFDALIETCKKTGQELGVEIDTSIALLDAVKSVMIPTVEVHISKVEEREDFRQISYIRQACCKTITGCGIDGYAMAINHLVKGK